MKAAANPMSAPSSNVGTSSTAIPWFIYAVLFGSTSIIIGLQWDISWHMTIGRDTFWSPPHLAIYLGGVVAGLASGWMVLRTTFAGGPTLQAESIRLWGFRGPLGAFVGIWGAFAMVTSAPFDDWWHNTYGLDTKILSPPHMVLAVGIMAIQIGAILTVLALQNRREEHPYIGDPQREPHRRRLRGMYVYAVGILLASVGLTVAEYTPRVLMHSSIFYQIVCGAFPLFIVGAARAARRP